MKKSRDCARRKSSAVPAFFSKLSQCKCRQSFDICLPALSLARIQRPFNDGDDDADCLSGERAKVHRAHPRIRLHFRLLCDENKVVWNNWSTFALFACQLGMHCVPFLFCMSFHNFSH